MTTFQSYVLSFVANHSAEEFREVLGFYVKTSPILKTDDEYKELFHAAVIAWQNPLGGQVDLEPENEIENRQAMDL